MSTASNTITVQDLQTLISELEIYYETLLEENRSISSIKAEEIYQVQTKKHESFLRIDKYKDLIADIFYLFENPKQTKISPKIMELAKKKITDLLKKIQILGKSNQQLLKSLEKHTDDLLNNIAPEKRKVTYDNPKRRR